MIWLDYTVEQAGNNFTVRGDWSWRSYGLMQRWFRKEKILTKPR